MRTAKSSAGSSEVVDEDGRREAARRRAALALLREHPDAMIFAQSADGQIVPVPSSLGLDGYTLLEEEGRTGADLCVAEDRMAVVNAWIEMKREGVAEASARLRSDPHTWRVVRMLDLRRSHGVILTIGWIGEQHGVHGARVDSAVSSTPRFATRKQDSEGNVIECDEAYLQMFGFGHEVEVVGHPTFERVHVEDQARLIESWIAMVATGRPQMARVRTRRTDESWLWVDTTYHNYLNDPDGGYVLAECIDVSAEMEAQEALQDREALLRRLIEELPDGLLQLDAQRRVVYSNTLLLELLGLPVTELGDAQAPLDSLLRRFAPDMRARLRAAIDAALQDGTAEDVELSLGARRKEDRRILFKVRPLLRDDLLVAGVIASVRDVTDSVRARLELERQASTDPLTGACNRSATIAALTAELDAMHPVGVVYVDFDHFKQVNDTHGHAAGDELLCQATSRLRDALRTDDLLGRLGGDEFLILLRGVSHVDAAMKAAHRIGSAVAGSYALSGATVELTTSIGVAFNANALTSAERVLEKADEAMYQSKRARRGIPVLAGS